MTVDPSAERIHELRMERQSIEWGIADDDAAERVTPQFVFDELDKVCEALLVALDDREEKTGDEQPQEVPDEENG